MENVGTSKKRKIRKKLFFWTCIIFILVPLTTYTLIKTFLPEKERQINYVEKSNINYKVYLKENNFYENEYIEENMLYVASLIDKINIDFKYIFSIYEKLSLDFDYSIIGKLVVSDETGMNNYYKKEYVLLDTKNAKIEKNNELVINESIDIDYNYYNQIVNEFRSTYGLNVNSRLEIYMVVSKRNLNNLIVETDNISSYMKFIVPLSEKAVNVKMEFKDLNQASYFVKKPNLNKFDKPMVIFSCILIICLLYSIIKFVNSLRRIFKHRGEYEKYINKILKEYDRLIVETTNLPEYDEFKILHIDKISELVDVHDNLNIPINYFLNKNKNISYFYILHNGTIYLYTVKKSEFSKN